MANIQFSPTVLLVMEHNITGLKYFCKTTLLDRVRRYKGSGTRWTNHLKVHGTDVKVGLLGFYVEEERCRNAAKQFSVENNIVESDEWANLVEETGMMGASMKGERNSFYGKTHTPEAIEKIFSHRKMNKLEKIVANLLDREKIPYKFQFFINKNGICKSYDFKLLNNNIILEIDGDFLVWLF
jgi:hypothetical protein